MYNEIEGNLITLAKEGKFDVIAHGCNCFCTMGAGIAPQMAKAFGADKFLLEADRYRGDINKLGQIDYRFYGFKDKEGPVTSTKKDKLFKLAVVNAYTQYDFSSRAKPFDYEAFTLCMRKINHTFKGKHIGLPQIGAGLAGGIWDLGEGDQNIFPFGSIGEWNDFKQSGKKPIKTIIQNELKDCDVTVVIYKP